MKKSPTYCVMPHIGIALQNHSDYCCCNVNKASWQNNKREVVYVHSHSAKSVYQSHTRKMIAASLDHGIKHPSCQVCWDLEDTGNKSPRQTLNHLFEGIEAIPTQPRILIIKPGNTCNYACRMCNPITSSSWYADGYELEKADLVSSSWYTKEKSEQVATLTYNQYTKTFETIRNSFNRDNEDFWGTLKEWIKELVYIDIYGGEPFLIPAMFDLLKHGIEIGASKNIDIHIHTNASILNEEYLQILSQYKNVSFNVSIDSLVPEQLEYIRHKAKFDTVIKTSSRFFEIVKDHPNIKMGITNTITPLNVFYTDRTNAGLTEMFNLPINTNIVTTPEYDIRHLPIPVKNYLMENLSNKEVTGFLTQTISGCDIEWPKFCRTTDKLDELRGQSFAKTFPEWWEMLEPYWIK